MISKNLGRREALWDCGRAHIRPNVEIYAENYLLSLFTFSLGKNTFSFWWYTLELVDKINVPASSVETKSRNNTVIDFRETVSS